MRSHYSKPRHGFTIIELLVAAGVSMLLMVIITEAFKRGIDMFRSMRAAGNMQERLRTAGTSLRDDLAAHHFPPGGINDPDNNPGGSIQPYVSELTRRDDWTPPLSGFFRVYQGAMTQTGFHTLNPADLPMVVEGTDPDGMLFTRATSHMLHFTMLRKVGVLKTGTILDDMFRAQEPQVGLPPSPTPGFPTNYIDPVDASEPGIFATQWAEIAYFLSPNGETANGTPLHCLHRRQLLLVPPAQPGLIPGGLVQAPPAPFNNPEISTRLQLGPPPGYFYNRASSVTQPRSRLGMQPAMTSNTDATTDLRSAGLPQALLFPPPLFHRYPRFQDPAALGGFGPNSDRAGDDVILSDVISFEVKVAWEPNAPFFSYTVGPTLYTETQDPAPLPNYTIPGLGVVANSDYPFDYLPLSTRNQVLSSRGIRVFDTWSRANNSQYRLPLFPPGPGPSIENWQRFQSTADTATGNATAPRIPLRIRVKAVLIRIRIWDAKAEQTRQLTIIQDL